MLPFYFIFNEWHSQTTSEKIRAVINKQAEQGKHWAYAPYGYSKDPNDRYKLVIDPYPASVVKRIFDMRLQKMSFGAIAKALNAEGVISPSGYSAEKRGVPNKRTDIPMWTSNVVIGIIERPEYCGDVAHGKVGCASYKNQKQKRRPKDTWTIVQNMHEPIVSKEDFQKCAEIRNSHKRIRSTKEQIVASFTGLMRCPDCGRYLTRTNTSYTVNTGEKITLVGYNCATYKTKGKTACTAHYILERDLKEIVIADIKAKAGEVLQDESAARERFYAIKSQSSGAQITHDRATLKKVNKRLGELDKLLQAAFEKSVLGGVDMSSVTDTVGTTSMRNTANPTNPTDSPHPPHPTNPQGITITTDTSTIFADYARRYETEKQELIQQAIQLSESIERQSQTENDVETFIALMKKYVNITDLDRATAVELIDRITVSASSAQPREIVIYYNFLGSAE